MSKRYFPLSSVSSMRGLLALLPLLVFLSFFLGAGLYFQWQGVDYAFYQLPAPVAALPAIVLAVWLSRAPLNKAIEQFIEGAGHSNIITMCMIYLLAGAFSSVAKATGGVDATVALGLQLIPGQFLLPGLFILSAFVATAMGTSMGTLAAMAPIGLGVAQASGIEPALVAGALMSGAIFGDNLSIISDTTIAATRTQGCQMRDKFWENLRFALPAALIALVLFAQAGAPTAELPVAAGNPWLALPYLLVLGLAISGLNVFVVLSLGMLATVLVGFWQAGYAVSGLAQDIYTGFGQMQEIFILSMLIGGLSELMRRQGGLDYLVRGVTKVAKALSRQNQAGHSLAIAGLISLTNLCVANNTVSIIVAGEAAKQLAEHGGINPKRSASLLDIFSCIVQGLIPYGAQALLLGASFGLSPLVIIPNVFYCFVLALVAIAVVTANLLWVARTPANDLRQP
ncbi:Na+/H+ antiporter NhaC family protein [Aliiglaciecola sp. CAU 1673]|uniref:Na+/H+ antiporter NhaC family protein n=1 Tax=Aliiglaciecola sp. CAU 1673 TaxID=3032595 RepID=UPI0023DCA5F7|nr:Na+/H+ antiporter NhaC family protein [Aliiglaciecola sp. CAU 1673]MDF2176862.1 Na+/H+ antiporter NhaC family protein [Aliiglaciecola sp. CAU 1673]